MFLQDELLSTVSDFFSDDCTDKEKIKKSIIANIQKVEPEKIICLALLDPKLNQFCKKFVPDDYWNTYLQYNTVNTYTMQQRKDLDAFPHVAAYVCFLKSKNHVNTQEARAGWHQLALEYGSWRAHMKQTFQDESTLFHSAKDWCSWTEAMPLIKQTIERSLKIALQDWTPGFILLAYTYQFIGRFFGDNVENTPTLVPMRDQFYRLSLTAYEFAEKLMANEYSDIALQNATLGDKDNLPRMFKIKNIESAKNEIPKNIKVVVDAKSVGFFAAARTRPDGWSQAFSSMPVPDFMKQ